MFLSFTGLMATSFTVIMTVKATQNRQVPAIHKMSQLFHLTVMRNLWRMHYFQIMAEEIDASIT